MSDKDQEIGRLKALVAVLFEAVVVSDSYGVQGSEFSTCLCCGAGGAPGVEFKHTDRCAAGHAEETADRWFREQQDEAAEVDKETAEMKAEIERLWATIKKAHAALTKSSLTPAERVFDATLVLSRALQPQGNSQ